MPTPTMTNSDTSAHLPTVASTLNGIAREQIRVLFTKHSLSAEEIAEQMRVPLALVIEVLERVQAPGGALTGSMNGSMNGSPSNVTPKEFTSLEEDTQERLDDARRIERGLDEHVDEAIRTLGTLIVCGESDGIKLAASTKLLEMRSGGLRPRRSERQQRDTNVALTAEDLAKLLAAANEAYLAQMPKANVATAVTVESAAQVSNP